MICFGEVKNSTNSVLRRLGASKVWVGKLPAICRGVAMTNYPSSKRSAASSGPLTNPSRGPTTCLERSLGRQVWFQPSADHGLSSWASAWAGQFAAQSERGISLVKQAGLCGELWLTLAMGRAWKIGFHLCTKFNKQSNEYIPYSNRVTLCNFSF